jgi:hypothetical protein
MIISANENLCYCLDCYSPVLVAEIQFDPKPKNRDEPRKKKIATLWDDPPSIIGEIKVDLRWPQKLHNFGAPITDGEMILEKGSHKFTLLNIDIPRHRYLRNIDIVIVDNTHFGLAFGGLTTIIKRQYRTPLNAEEIRERMKIVDRIGREVFEISRQFDLPFRDSS